jgi:hypothetical protein
VFPQSFFTVLLMNFWLFQIKKLSLRSSKESVLIWIDLDRFRNDLVEPRRIELLTPCVQGRCSPS